MLPPKSTVYLGSVGNDSDSQILKQQALEDGLETLYMVCETVPTGKCAVLITNNDRSMVTDLKAANEFKLEFLEKPEIWPIVAAAKNYYVGGYFLTVSPPSALKIAKHACESDKVFSLNLSAPFIPQFFKDPLASLLPYVDILFGNETEAQAFADSNDFKTTGKEHFFNIKIYLKSLF